jgi:hypothetical protein
MCSPTAFSGAIRMIALAASAFTDAVRAAVRQSRRTAAGSAPGGAGGDRLSRSTRRQA